MRSHLHSKAGSHPTVQGDGQAGGIPRSPALTFVLAGGTVSARRLFQSVCWKSGALDDLEIEFKATWPMRCGAAFST